MQKKLLLLGGSAQQIVAIKKAKELGYYTILCDYLNDNPGQDYSDEYYNVSTTDKEAILDLSRELKIDGILAYASDPAAPTAAYVSENLGLSGNPFDSVNILCNKDLFRKFLQENDFNTPMAKGYDDIKIALNDLRDNVFKFPVIIKPVDSSGSKGVSKCDNFNEAKDLLINAMSYSISKRIIIEEYVEMYGYQVAGDGLSIDGRLVFRYFANDHFNKESVNPFVPISASFPYNMDEKIHDKIHNEIQRLITLLNMKTCTYNFDIRVDKDFNVYLMEIAPRNGGNYIPQIINYATGIDLVEYAIKAAMGEKLELPNNINPSGFWSYYAVHSLEEGILEDIVIDEEVITNNIVENHIIKHKGDLINAFVGANSTLGCLIMKFNSMDEMIYMMDNSKEWINIKVR